MDAFTSLVLGAGAVAAATATRSRLLRDPWNFMLLAKVNHRRAVRAEDGLTGGRTQSQIDLLAAKHFGGTFRRVTVGDMFPVLCSPEWCEAVGVMLGCLVRHRLVPRSFRPPPWGQYELLRAYWVPRPRRRHHYASPGTALDYLHLASTYGALSVRAEDGAVERVPADWFRGYLRSQDWSADEAPIHVLLRALEPDGESPPGRQHAVNARRCITGRLKREAVLHPDFTDEVPELQPERFAPRRTAELRQAGQDSAGSSGPAELSGGT